MLLYNLACYESLAGRRDDAVAHLRRAIELDGSYRALAAEDPDFDPIRESLQSSRPFSSDMSLAGTGGGADGVSRYWHEAGTDTRVRALYRCRQRQRKEKHVRKALLILGILAALAVPAAATAKAPPHHLWRAPAMAAATAIPAVRPRARPTRSASRTSRMLATTSS